MTRQAFKLAHLITRPFPASPIRSRDGDLNARARRGGDAPGRFERRVFRYLAPHKREHGIATVHKLGNVRVDGMVVLKNGRRLVVETKYRMGWLKACQAGWQVGDFLQRPEGRKNRPTGALIIFEAFSGDWARRWKNGKIEKGWIHWYVGHARLPGREGEGAISIPSPPEGRGSGEGAGPLTRPASPLTRVPLDDESSADKESPPCRTRPDASSRLPSCWPWPGRSSPPRPPM